MFCCSYSQNDKTVHMKKRFSSMSSFVITFTRQQWPCRSYNYYSDGKYCSVVPFTDIQKKIRMLKKDTNCTMIGLMVQGGSVHRKRYLNKETLTVQPWEKTE